MKKTKMLKKNYEFKKVLTKGKYYSGKYIEAFIQDNKKQYNLLGLAISVKIAKAVKRNQIKRYLRESYKVLEPNIMNGKNIIFLWKRKAYIREATFQNIYQDMNFIFKKANFFNKDNK